MSPVYPTALCRRSQASRHSFQHRALLLLGCHARSLQFTPPPRYGKPSVAQEPVDLTIERKVSCVVLDQWEEIQLCGARPSERRVSCVVLDQWEEIRLCGARPSERRVGCVVLDQWEEIRLCGARPSERRVGCVVLDQ